MLQANIDPAEIMGCIPESYLRNSNITYYKIPDSVMFIDCYAFSGCKSLTSITIPNSVISIGDRAFEDCRSLRQVKYLGTKKEALTILEVKNKMWRDRLNIEKIICTDGVIYL